MLHENCDFLMKNYVRFMRFLLAIIYMGFHSILQLKFGKKYRTVKTFEGKNFGEFGESQQFANFFANFPVLQYGRARRNVSCVLIVLCKNRGKGIDIAVF